MLIKLIKSMFYADDSLPRCYRIERSGSLIYASPKCTTHIDIRGFRAIYAAGADGFMSIKRDVVRSPAVSPISTRNASRPT